MRDPAIEAYLESVREQHRQAAAEYLRQEHQRLLEEAMGAAVLPESVQLSEVPEVATVTDPPAEL
ncbi:hypothetical protein HY218_02120 [Candidatus Saccharibacteria bacterium]|nr:hypothetical protein [Candidatus Saccharibacteria bacterium]